MTTIINTIRYMNGANLVIPAHISDLLSRGQAEFPRILGQNGQNCLEGQGQLPPFLILGRELGPSGVSPNQRSRWKLVISLLKHDYITPL